MDENAPHKRIIYTSFFTTFTTLRRLRIISDTLRMLRIIMSKKTAISSIIWVRQTQFSPVTTSERINGFFLKTYLSELGTIFLTIKTAFEAITPDPKNDLLKSLIE